MTVTFITSNPGKAEEVQRFLGVPIDHVPLDLKEIQSLDPEEIVREKASEAYKTVGKPVLIEDVSFTLSALGGALPGPLIKWFMQELGNDGMCRLVDGKSRNCVASVLYGFHDGKDVHFFAGEMKGSISENPRGERSFGWAAIFVPEGMDKTYAELSDDEQSKVAMRQKALEKLRAYLQENK